MQQSLEDEGAKDTNEKEHRKFTKALLSLEPEGSEEEAFSRALWHNHKKKPKALMDGLEESLEDSSSEENECDSEEMPEPDQFLAELEGQASSSKPQKPDKATKAEEKKRKQEAREHEKEKEKKKSKRPKKSKQQSAEKIEQQEEKWQQEVEQASNCPDNKMAVSLRKRNSLLAVELKNTQEAMKQHPKHSGLKDSLKALQQDRLELEEALVDEPSEEVGKALLKSIAEKLKRNKQIRKSL